MRRMPYKDLRNVESLSTVRLNDSGKSGVVLECALSRERSSTVSSSEAEIKAAVRRLQDQHTGKPGRSLYLEMRARREGLGFDREDTSNFNRKHPGRCIRAPWCALTVLFWSYDHLARRLRVLPGKLKAGMSCWVWVAHESKALWPGYDKVATCVVLLAGVPASFTVRRIAGLLLSSDGKSLDTETECSPGWWLYAMSGKTAVEDWLNRHDSVLCQVNYVARASTNGEVDAPRVLIPRQDVGRTQGSPEYRSRRLTTGVVDVAGGRKPLGEISGNAVTR